MIKIIHTADVHLDSPLKSLALKDEELKATVQTATRTAFTRMVDFALDPLHSAKAGQAVVLWKSQKPQFNMRKPMALCKMVTSA